MLLESTRVAESSCIISCPWHSYSLSLAYAPLTSELRSIYVTRLRLEIVKPIASQQAEG